MSAPVTISFPAPACVENELLRGLERQPFDPRPSLDGDGFAVPYCFNCVDMSGWALGCPKPRCPHRRITSPGCTSSARTVRHSTASASLRTASSRCDLATANADGPKSAGQRRKPSSTTRCTNQAGHRRNRATTLPSVRRRVGPPATVSRRMVRSARQTRRAVFDSRTAINLRTRANQAPKRACAATVTTAVTTTTISQFGASFIRAQDPRPALAAAGLNRTEIRAHPRSTAVDIRRLRRAACRRAHIVWAPDKQPRGPTPWPETLTRSAKPHSPTVSRRCDNHDAGVSSWVRIQPIWPAADRWQAAPNLPPLRG